MKRPQTHQCSVVADLGRVCNLIGVGCHEGGHARNNVAALQEAASEQRDERGTAVLPHRAAQEAVEQRSLHEHPAVAGRATDLSDAAHELLCVQDASVLLYYGGGALGKRFAREHNSLNVKGASGARGCGLGGLGSSSRRGSHSGCQGLAARGRGWRGALGPLRQDHRPAALAGTCAPAPAGSLGASTASRSSGLAAKCGGGPKYLARRSDGAEVLRASSSSSGSAGTPPTASSAAKGAHDLLARRRANACVPVSALAAAAVGSHELLLVCLLFLEDELLGLFERHSARLAFDRAR